jgi:hypothetical protein
MSHWAWLHFPSRVETEARHTLRPFGLDKRYAKWSALWLD